MTEKRKQIQEIFENMPTGNFMEDFKNGAVEIPVHKKCAKADSGKPRLSLVPASLERAVCSIREYGTKKYHGDSENWKNVEPQRYFEAMLRHTNAMRENGIYSCDEESGLPHLHHLACSISFLIEFENMEQRSYDSKM